MEEECRIAILLFQIQKDAILYLSYLVAKLLYIKGMSVGHSVRFSFQKWTIYLPCLK